MSVQRPIKRIVIELSSEEYDMLKRLKKTKTWREFLFELLEFKYELWEKSVREVCKSLEEVEEYHLSDTSGLPLL